MKIENYPTNLENIILDPNEGRYTCFADVQAIIAIIKEYSIGNIVEIGCATGITTRDLAKNFPDRIIYAIDSTENNIHEGQKNEKPNKDIICFSAKNYPNVKVIDDLSTNVDYASFDRIGAIFVDADHTYEGVKKDTEKILETFSTKHILVIWHDYYDSGSFEWVGVKKYIDEIIDKIYEVHRVSGTNIVWAII